MECQENSSDFFGGSFSDVDWYVEAVSAASCADQESSDEHLKREIATNSSQSAINQQTIMEFWAKIISNQPRIFGTANTKIVVFVPNLFRIIPEITQDKAAPRHIIETDHENSFSVILNLCEDCRISTSEVDDQPRLIP
jgi:hypothetical protein